MLFAELSHPYDDPEDPPAWAWRYGHFELLFTRSIKALTLSRGPKYSTRGPRYCCRICQGSGYLPTRPDALRERGADPRRRCPTCPARRVLIDHMPIWPVRALNRLDSWRFRLTRRRAVRATDPWNDSNPTADYADEPPF